MQATAGNLTPNLVGLYGRHRGMDCVWKCQNNAIYTILPVTIDQIENEFVVKKKIVKIIRAYIRRVLEFRTQMKNDSNNHIKEEWDILHVVMTSDIVCYNRVLCQFKRSRLQVGTSDSVIE